MAVIHAGATVTDKSFSMVPPSGGVWARACMGGGREASNKTPTQPMRALSLPLMLSAGWLCVCVCVCVCVYVRACAQVRAAVRAANPHLVNRQQVEKLRSPAYPSLILKPF